MRLLALAFILSTFAPTQAQDLTDQIALQTWTTRNLTFEETVDFAVKMDIDYLQMWSSISGGHMTPMAAPEEIQRQKDLLDKNGLKMYAFGVTRDTRNEDELRKTFEFAKLMGAEVIAAEPESYSQLDLIEAFAIVYDIKVAFHNHDIHSPFGIPEVVLHLLDGRDARLGVCLDIGWMTTTRRDVAEVFELYGDRVHDIHLKDKVVTATAEGDQHEDVNIGLGDANYVGLFKAMRESGYAGRMAIETDQDLEDPTDFVRGAIEFVKEN